MPKTHPNLTSICSILGSRKNKGHTVPPVHPLYLPTKHCFLQSRFASQLSPAHNASSSWETNQNPCPQPIPAPSCSCNGNAYGCTAIYFPFYEDIAAYGLPKKVCYPWKYPHSHESTDFLRHFFYALLSHHFPQFFFVHSPHLFNLIEINIKYVKTPF